MYYDDAVATFGVTSAISSPPAEASEAPAPTISAPWPADASGITGALNPAHAPASAGRGPRRAPEFVPKSTGCGGLQSS